MVTIKMLHQVRANILEMNRKKSQIRCVFYIYNTSPFRPATFQVFNSHMWPMTTVLHSEVLDLYPELSSVGL